MNDLDLTFFLLLYDITLSPNTTVQSMFIVEKACLVSAGILSMRMGI